MTYPLLKRKFISGRCLAVFALGCSGLISACSSDGSTTILENGQTFLVDVPTQLTGAGSPFDEDDLRPVVTLSNGETVGTTSVGDNRWSGTINVETDAVYTVTITWVERFNDQDLPLTRRTLDIAVGADGSAVEVEGNRTEYSEQGRDMDLDGDGVSNLDERLANQNPLPFETVDVPGVEEPVMENPDVENPGAENPGSENPETENPETGNPGNDKDFPESILNITAGNRSRSFKVGMAEPLEQPLLDGILDIGDLRPVVKVSLGANETTVTMQREDDNSWNGEFNANSAGVYKVEFVWVEEYEGQPLELTSRSFDVAIGEDNSIAETGGTGWDTALYADEDRQTNLEERLAGTDPRRDESERAVPTTIINTGNLSDSSQTSIISDSLPASSDVIVPRISVIDAPAIDGMNVTTDNQNQLTGEWAQAVQSDTRGATLSIENLLINNDAENVGNGPYRRWAAMHDGRFLYVVVLVDDNGKRYRDSGNVLFDDDSLELYLDADYGRSTTVDNNHFHRQFPLRAPGGNDNATSKTGVTSGDLQGPGSSTAPLPIDFATGPGIGPDGLRRANFEQDVYELRIPLEAAGISSDSPFGFELHINDDDDGQTRDSRWGWMQSVTGDAGIDEGLPARPSMGVLMLE